jgi:branched-chain amino acid transport system ATP-binding protein
MLELEGVHTHYGPIEALKGVSLSLQEGQIVTVLGANGAGKSTLINTVCGVVHPSAGEIRLEDRPIHGKRPESIVQWGIVQVPEGRQLFTELTVAENLRMGGYARRDRQALKHDRAYVLDLFPRLKERIDQPAGTLSGGEQQMLAIGRALMAKPRVLLLDEPSLGLAPVLVRQVYETLEQLNDDGIPLLLAEQNANMALSVADYAYVLTLGQMTLQGPAGELREDDNVRKLYLGESEELLKGGDGATDDDASDETSARSP